MDMNARTLGGGSLPSFLHEPAFLRGFSIACPSCQSERYLENGSPVAVGEGSESLAQLLHIVTLCIFHEMNSYSGAYQPIFCVLTSPCSRCNFMHKFVAYYTACAFHEMISSQKR